MKGIGTANYLQGNTKNWPQMERRPPRPQHAWLRLEAILSLTLMRVCLPSLECSPSRRRRPEVPSPVSERSGPSPLVRIFSCRLGTLICSPSCPAAYIYFWLSVRFHQKSLSLGDKMGLSCCTNFHFSMYFSKKAAGWDFFRSQSKT